MNKTETKRAAAILSKCGGNCKDCARLHFYSVTIPNASGSAAAVSHYFAWGCDALPVKKYSCIADTVRELHGIAAEILREEGVY